MTSADHANTVREKRHSPVAWAGKDEFDAALDALQAQAEERDRLRDALRDIAWGRGTHAQDVLVARAALAGEDT